VIYRHEEQEKHLKLKWDGYRPSLPTCRPELWEDFAEYLVARNLNPELARYNGWYPTKYKGCDRILIPCSNREGVPYFQARAMTDDVQLRYASPAAPRDDSIVIVWPESKLKVKGCVVIEGPMDALAAAEFDYVGIALMGNQPTDAVIEHLSGFVRSFQPVWIVPDADSLHMGPNVLCALVQHSLSGMILTPPKKDLAAMSRKERRSFLYA